MPVHRGARAGLLLPWGWVALCLMSLLHLNNLTSVASENSTQGVFPPVPTNESTEESITSSIPGSTSHYYLIGQDSNKTTPAISETTVNFTATPGTPSGSGTPHTFSQPQTYPTVTLPTTSDSTSTPEVEHSTWNTSLPSVNVSDYSPNNVSSEMISATEPCAHTSSSVPSIIKGDIKCSGIRGVPFTQGICLELSEASSCVSWPWSSSQAPNHSETLKLPWFGLLRIKNYS